MLTIDIPENHACFAGHFPGQPILPGVLLLERVMTFAQGQLAGSLKNFRLYNVKFLAPVLPGAKLQVSLTASNPGEHKFGVYVLDHDGQASTIACSGQLRVLANEVPA